MEKYYYYLTDNGLIISEENIIKPSESILDLIEVGDYVNGYKVDFIQNGYVVFNHNHPYKINIYPKDIKDIVTKEQFEFVKYEVE